MRKLWLTTVYTNPAVCRRRGQDCPGAAATAAGRPGSSCRRADIRPRNLFLFLIMLAGISACANKPAPPLSAMTDIEVYQYNQDKPLMEKIYCYENARTGSHIRRRTCLKVADYLKQNKDNADSLSVVQPVSDRTFDPFRQRQ